MLRSTKQNIAIQGHRGCRGLYPENSFPAFEHAINLGVDTLELDVAITKNNEVVVSHEPFMSRTICIRPDRTDILKSEDMQFNLYKMTHREIRDFDCGLKYHLKFPKQEKIPVYKPLLKDIFELAKAKNASVNFNIEIKSKTSYYGKYTPYPEEYVSIVLDEIQDSQMFNRVNLQSFDINILEEIKKQSPKMEIALLVDEDENVKSKLSELSFKPEIISPYYKLLNTSIVNKWKSKNFKVIPWTVNSEKEMLQMIDFEVDGIITDYPDRLIKLISK